jgi:hypothetical protein
MVAALCVMAMELASFDRCEWAALRAEVQVARAQAKLNDCEREAMVEVERQQANEIALGQFGRVQTYPTGRPRSMFAPIPGR